MRAFALETLLFGAVGGRDDDGRQHLDLVFVLEVGFFLYVGTHDLYLALQVFFGGVGEGVDRPAAFVLVARVVEKIENLLRVVRGLRVCRRRRGHDGDVGVGCRILIADELIRDNARDRENNDDKNSFFHTC